MRGQAVQAIGAAVFGLRLVAEARHAAVAHPLFCSFETGGRVSAMYNNFALRAEKFYK